MESRTLTAPLLAGTASPLSDFCSQTLGILTSGGPCRPADLAEALTVDRVVVTKNLLPLLGDELVYRIADVDDARDWLLAITAKGARALSA